MFFIVSLMHVFARCYEAVDEGMKVEDVTLMLLKCRSRETNSGRHDA